MVKDSMKEQSSLESSEIFQLLYAIPDPEVPVINIGELGVLRSVDWINGQLIITITPTYSGCPAMFAIESEIKTILKDNNISNFKVKTVYFPAWTTDWLTDEAKRKLSDYGIAPPEHS
ncbi:MAG TPA: iron-sulfur cluster assembly protein, partial [Bacteroidia bacterium]|nr:iron-sulfur cluster assembly protein [Bacteroidia bacterium]